LKDHNLVILQLVRNFSRPELPQADPERKNISLESWAFSFKKLRCPVGKSSGEVRSGGGVGSFLDDLTTPEVGEFAATILRNQNVGRFQVEMCDVIAMHIFQRQSHLICKPNASFKIDLFVGVVKNMLKVSGAYKLHDDTRLVFQGFCGVRCQNTDDVRMLERQDFVMHLGLKALHRSFLIASVGVKFL